MRTLLSILAVSFVFMAFQTDSKQSIKTEKHPFQQVYESYTLTIQQELKDADALELLWTVKWSELSPSESFNMLRDKGVYTEEIFTQSGNVAKYYLSYTAKLKSADKKTEWLQNYNSIKVKQDIASVVSIDEIKKSLQIDRVPMNAKSSGSSKCEATMNYKKQELTEDFVNSMNEANLDKQSFQNRGYQKHVLQYAMHSIALQAYANNCK